MHVSETLFKLDFTLGYRNITMKLYTIICSGNNESETNIIRRMKPHKKILLALVLVHSTVVDTIFDTSSTILVMVPVDAGFSGVWIPFTYRANPSTAPHIKVELLMKLDTLTLCLAYLILLLIH